jgi:transposase
MKDQKRTHKKNQIEYNKKTLKIVRNKTSQLSRREKKTDEPNNLRDTHRTKTQMKPTE